MLNSIWNFLSGSKFAAEPGAVGVRGSCRWVARILALSLGCSRSLSEPAVGTSFCLASSDGSFVFVFTQSSAADGSSVRAPSTSAGRTLRERGPGTSFCQAPEHFISQFGTVWISSPARRADAVGRRAAGFRALRVLDVFFSSLATKRSGNGLPGYRSPFVFGRGHFEKNFGPRVPTLVLGMSDGLRDSLDDDSFQIMGNDHVLDS